jgi:hypothetical protein
MPNEKPRRLLYCLFQGKYLGSGFNLQPFIILESILMPTANEAMVKKALHFLTTRHHTLPNG